MLKCTEIKQGKAPVPHRKLLKSTLRVHNIQFPHPKFITSMALQRGDSGESAGDISTPLALLQAQLRYQCLFR